MRLHAKKSNRMGKTNRLETREVTELKARLAEAEEALRAIRNGEVDALVVSTSQGDKVFTIEGADTPYRLLVEAMNEGALLILPDGTILFANTHFATLAKTPLEQINGASWEQFFPPEEHLRLTALLKAAQTEGNRGEFSLLSGDGSRLPVGLSLRLMKGGDGAEAITVIVTDLTERKAQEEFLRQAKAELEARVRERTSELAATNENLRSVIAEQERTEQALRESEARYRLLFEQNYDGIFALDSGGRFIVANPACETISGYSVAELLHTTFPELCAPDQLAQTTEVFEQGIRGNSPQKIETAFVHKDGRRVELSVTSGPVMIQGKLTGIYCTARDITEHKRAEEALRESEARHRSLFETSMDAILLTVPDGRVVAANQAACDMFGMTEEEIRRVGRERLIDLTDPRLAAALEERRITGKIKCELNCLRKDGTKFPTEVNSVILDNGSKAFVILRDITERKRTEEAVHRRVEEIERLLEAVPAAVWVTYDPQCFTIIGNRRANEFYEAETEENVSATTFPKTRRFFAPDGRELAASELPMQMATATDQDQRDVELYVQLPSGRRIVMLGNAVPLRDEQGGVRGCISAFLDITARKQTEEQLRLAREQLRRHAEDLEKTVQARTAKLHELVGELEHFSYSIVHDMRAPLRSMSSFAAILTEECAGCLKPTNRDFLRRISRSAKRMDQLITDALQYSQVVRSELPLVPVDIEELLRGMIETYPAFQAPSADIRLEGPLPKVLGNRAYLTQCCSNLLDNAVKFVAPGVTPRVRVWAERREEGGGRREDGRSRMEESGKERGEKENVEHPTSNMEHRSGDSDQSLNPQLSTLNSFVRLWFEDNGIGIPEQGRHRIFDMFQRLHSGYEGTGIGLAIVRKVAERLGGKAGVESEPGRGSRFWLELRPAFD